MGRDLSNSAATPPRFRFLPVAIVVAAQLIPCTVLTALASPIFPPSVLHGIAPQDEEYYSRDVIPCRDGSRSFTRGRLNDGFCDCPDGTDEPGTSACPESRFYCRNTGDVPSILYSSRVNDHICDCCDGSDEYDGHTTCANRCVKGNNNTEIYFEGSQNSDKAHGHGERWMVDSLVENFTDLRIAIVMEFVVIVILLSCFCHWRSRFGRRCYLLTI